MHKDSFNKTEVLRKIIPVIEKAVEDSRLLLLEVDFVKEFNKWHLRIFIYHPKRPVTHEDCELITNRIDEYLDTLIPVHYYLEVSSPGTERKLKSSREYLIFKGSRVKIKLKQSVDEMEKVFIASIIDYNNDEGLKIRVEETNDIINIEEKNISYIKLEPDYKY